MWIIFGYLFGLTLFHYWISFAAFLIMSSKTSKHTSFEYFMKYSWSVFSQKSLLILTTQNTSLFFLKPMGIVTRWASYSQRTARCTVDSAKIMQQLNLMLRGEFKRVTKCWSDSVEITQDVSEWYREFQSCRKKSPLQLLRPAEHDLCGRLQFIHTKSTARKLLLESDSSGL